MRSTNGFDVDAAANDSFYARRIEATKTTCLMSVDDQKSEGIYHQLIFGNVNSEEKFRHLLVMKVHKLQQSSHTRFSPQVLQLAYMFSLHSNKSQFLRASSHNRRWSLVRAFTQSKNADQESKTEDGGLLTEHGFHN